MRDVTDPDLNDLWTCASPEALHRTASLARTGLRTAISTITSFAAAESTVRYELGRNDAASAEPFPSALDTPVRLPSGRQLGTLSVADTEPRAWNGDDVTLLELAAAVLGDHIDLAYRLDANGKNHDAMRTPPGVARILLADDLDLNRRLIADMLAIEGYMVDCVADGAAAVDAARGAIYDLILMDMVMPGMDGLEAARVIRTLPAPARAVPIVALTANCGQDQLDACIEAGMNATLTKPITFGSLTDTVAAWVGDRPKAA